MRARCSAVDTAEFSVPVFIPIDAHSEPRPGAHAAETQRNNSLFCHLQSGVKERSGLGYRAATVVESWLISE
jgi:hypothetical protein